MDTTSLILSFPLPASMEILWGLICFTNLYYTGDKGSILFSSLYTLYIPFYISWICFVSNNSKCALVISICRLLKDCHSVLLCPDTFIAVSGQTGVLVLRSTSDQDLKRG